MGLGVAGCTTDMGQGPVPQRLRDRAGFRVTVFRENAPQDPSGELYTVSIADVKTKCDYDKKKITTDSQVRVLFKASARRAAKAARINVPYFLSVTRHGDKILTKKLFFARLTFQPGEVSTSVEDKIDSTTINIARNAKVGEYAIMVGFQLTQAQLDYNTKTNHYAQ